MRLIAGGLISGVLMIDGLMSGGYTLMSCPLMISGLECPVG